MIFPLFLLAFAPTAQAANINLQPKGNESACFQGVYSAEHRRNNPKQEFSELTILVENIVAPPDSEVASYISAKLVGAKNGTLYGNAATCEYKANGSVFCFIECDGGSFSLRRGDRGVEFAVTPDYYFPFFRKGADPDQPHTDDTVSFSGKDPANSVYKLLPAKANACKVRWSQYKEVPNFGC
ncbi:MAG TPA: hypothetical protein VIH99_01130 [Bdellovibrionota bacterium]|jgi:hypothetical protein